MAEVARIRATRMAAFPLHVVGRGRPVVGPMRAPRLRCRPRFEAFSRAVVRAHRAHGLLLRWVRARAVARNHPGKGPSNERPSDSINYVSSSVCLHHGL